MTAGVAWLVALCGLLATLALSWHDMPDLTVLDAVVLRGIQEQRYPGAVLIVGIRGRTRIARAYGRHTYAPDSPEMTLDTLFDLASVTKVVAGTPAVLCLVEDDKLDLDSPVAKWWPEFAANGKDQVTLKDLLTHVSGLKAYEDYRVVENQRLPKETPADALYRHYAALPLAYPPRTKMVYSCLNLQTAAALVQKVSGEDLESLLKRRVWGPLGMKNTTYRPTGKLRTRCAPTAVDPDGQPVRGTVHDPLAAYHGSSRLCPGNAGVFSTAGDLVRYVEMVLGNGKRRGKRVLSAESVRLMTAVHTPEGVAPLRSVGWAVYSEPPFVPTGGQDAQRRTIGHTGYTGTWLWIDPPSRSYIIFLTNRVFPSPATGGEGASIDPIRADIARVVTEVLQKR